MREPVPADLKKKTENHRKQELGHLLGHMRALTASKDDIAYANKVTSNCVERCLLCLDDYADQDDIRLLLCRYAFHKDCVDRWLRRGAIIARRAGRWEEQGVMQSGPDGGENIRPSFSINSSNNLSFDLHRDRLEKVCEGQF
ncbi:hypothetical protein B0H14DRAFT_3491698 [Mycena olivaceomarginata]|nr:hypothetical protein B0H14DRAFT_3491698 [Mycena olivaceomarginata]